MTDPDIVARLRERAESYRQGGASSEHTALMLMEAADELERLRETGLADCDLCGGSGTHDDCSTCRVCHGARKVPAVDASSGCASTTRIS